MSDRDLEYGNCMVKRCRENARSSVTRNWYRITPQNSRYKHVTSEGLFRPLSSASKSRNSESWCSSTHREFQSPELGILGSGEYLPSHCSDTESRGEDR